MSPLKSEAPSALPPLLSAAILGRSGGARAGPGAAASPPPGRPQPRPVVRGAGGERGPGPLPAPQARHGPPRDVTQNRRGHGAWARLTSPGSTVTSRRDRPVALGTRTWARPRPLPAPRPPPPQRPLVAWERNSGAAPAGPARGARTGTGNAGAGEPRAQPAAGPS